MYLTIMVCIKLIHFKHTSQHLIFIRDHTRYVQTFLEVSFSQLIINRTGFATIQRCVCWFYCDVAFDWFSFQRINLSSCCWKSFGFKYIFDCMLSFFCGGAIFFKFKFYLSWIKCAYVFLSIDLTNNASTSIDVIDFLFLRNDPPKQRSKKCCYEGRRDAKLRKTADCWKWTMASDEACCSREWSNRKNNTPSSLWSHSISWFNPQGIFVHLLPLLPAYTLSYQPPTTTIDLLPLHHALFSVHHEW